MGDEIDLNSQFVQDLLLDRLLVHCNHRNLNDLDAVVDHLGQLCGDRNYEQWYAMWYHPETSKIVKANLRKSLFQAGLGLGGLNFGHGGPDWFYSLCRQSWQQVTDTHHVTTPSLYLASSILQYRPSRAVFHPPRFLIF